MSSCAFVHVRRQDAVTIAPVWSLRLEVGLYVLAAIAALTFLASGRLRILLCIFTAALFSAYCWRLAFGGLAVALFAAGGVAAIFFDRLVNIKPFWISAAVVLALALPIAWPTLIDDSTVSMIYQSALGVPLPLDWWRWRTSRRQVDPGLRGLLGVRGVVVYALCDPHSSRGRSHECDPIWCWAGPANRNAADLPVGRQSCRDCSRECRGAAKVFRETDPARFDA